VCENSEEHRIRRPICRTSNNK